MVASTHIDAARPKRLEVVAVPPPPESERVCRGAERAAEGEKRNRYHLPTHLDSASPVGYRTRPSLSHQEAAEALQLLALERPTSFVPAAPVREQELFEEAALGVLTSRQSTNFRGHRQVSFGPADSRRIAELLRRLGGLEAPVLDRAAYTHVVLSRPYRTPFTFLLTFVGHRPGLSLGTVPWRALRKRFAHADDIPTVGYLQQLHIGILAEAMERAAVLASAGSRRAQIFMAPFSSPELRRDNAGAIAALGDMCGIDAAARRTGWRVALVAQVGGALAEERVDMEPALYRKLGATLLACRSERIQPGVNHDEAAPPQYRARQSMNVPDQLTVMAGRAAYNAFAHWSGCDRERAKELLLLDRIDVLTPEGKQKLRAVRNDLNAITDRLVSNLPLWVDLPTGKLLSRNAQRGRKAFALAGQRIYVGGLGRAGVAGAGLAWDNAVQAVGAAAARSSLYAELMGCVDIPPGCDLLAGTCLMAGPVNQNDIGKHFYGYPDLLAAAYPDQDPTSLLLWTLKAKSVADPIGNEEQLQSAARKGALVDLRPAPHEVVQLAVGNRRVPMRRQGGRISSERAFADADNFVRAPDGAEIPGNRGSAWPRAWRDETPWPT